MERERAHGLEFLAGIEGTHIFGSGTDVLETTEHTMRYREDFRLLANDGIRTVRCCIPWHKIERIPGIYDWSWMDAYMACLRDFGLRPIVDPLHHTSFPHWLQGGFAHPEFGRRYYLFVEAFARRYPWVSRYTIINEPFVTAWLCGYCEIWHPCHAGYEGFVPMLLAVAHCICAITERLIELVPDVQFVHVDTCERHHALDTTTQTQVDTNNEMRFVVLDLILGRMHPTHPLYPLLRRYGMTEADLEQFDRQPARIDVLGLDYYSHSELGWSKEGRSEEFVASGFRQVAHEYVARYSMPVMLGETNLRGSITDRISWLAYMVSACEAFASDLSSQNLPFTGFCWYPYIDSTDWSSLVREARRERDPQGIYSLTPSFDREATELSELYALLARGSISSSDIPFYGFSKEVLRDRGVAKFKK